MSSLDKPVGTKIVATNSNVANVVSFCKVIEGCDEDRPIVGHYFVERSPSTNDVFEDLGTNVDTYGYIWICNHGYRYSMDTDTTISG